MKQLSLLTPLLALLLCTCGRALVAQVDIPASHPVDFISKFRDISVGTDGSGLVGGTCGALRETLNDGQTWETIESPTEQTIRLVACPPSGCSTAILATDDGGYYRSGGGAWTPITAYDVPAGGAIEWLSETTVVHFAGDLLYRSTDAGQTWTEIALPDNTQGNISILADGAIFQWRSTGLFKSVDDALTFQAVGYVHPTSVREQTWLDDQRGWIFDAERLFYGTTDGGQTWTLLNAESQLTSVNWMLALSPTHLVGAQITTTRLESTDGGVTWERGSFLDGGNRRVNENYHQRGTEIFTVGDASQLLYSPADFTDFVELDPFPRNARVTQIAAASNTVAYAAANPDLLGTTDGINWNVLASGFSIRDLTVLDDGRVVLLSPLETLISDDGGATFTNWVPTTLHGNGQFGIVFSQKPNGDFYLLTSRFASRSTDGGNNWTAVEHGVELSFHGLFWLTDDVGYSFTRQQHFAKTTDGGDSWTVSEGPVRNLEGIWFVDEMNGWVSTASARYVTADGGATWASVGATGGYDYQEHPTDGSLLSAHYLGGNDGEILRSTDDGENWRPLNFNCYAYRAGAASPDGKYFWTGGDGGFIVRHDLEALIEQANSVGGRRPLPQVRITASPNPTGGLVRINLPASATEGTLQVVDLSGREVHRFTVARGTTTFDVDLGGAPTGVYVVRWSGGGAAGRVKVVRR